MPEEAGQEVVEIGLGDGFAEDGGHEAEVGFGVVGDLGFLDGVFLTGGGGEDEGGAYPLIGICFFRGTLDWGSASGREIE